jgi:hypothetical protein
MTVGNTVVLSVLLQHVGGTPTFSGTSVTSWTQIKTSQSQSVNTSSFWYGTVVASGTGVGIANSTSGFVIAHMAEFSGITGLSNSAMTNFASTSSAYQAIVANANELVCAYPSYESISAFSGLAHNYNTSPFSWSNGLDFAYTIDSGSGGTYTPTWMLQSPSTDVVFAATFAGTVPPVTGTVSIALGPLAVSASGTATTVITGTAPLALGPLRIAATSTIGGCARVAYLTLNGQTVLLEDATNGYFCTQLDLGYPTVREVVSNQPDQDGIDDRTQYMGSRVVTANITAVAGAGARIDEIASSFAPFMAPNARPVLHYALDRPGLAERTLTLRGSGYSWPIAGPYQRDIQLQWVAADPVAYDPTVKTATATSVTVTHIVPAGDLPVRPLFRITGPTTGPAVILTPSSGPVWMLAFLATFSVAAGHYIDIDTQARTVLLDGDPAQPRLSSLDWTVSSWQWIPTGMSTAMALTGSGTTGATQVTATWQDGYLT